MTFHTQKQFIPQKKQTWLEKFTSQSHQLFFGSAALFSLLFMALTLFSFQGVLDVSFQTIYNFGLNYAVFTNAFLGFLITVIPKYTSSITVTKKQYLITWILLQIGIFITLAGFEMLGKITVACTVFYINTVFYTVIQKGKSSYKKESIFLNILLFIGAFLLLWEAFFHQNLSIVIFFGYLMALVFTVAQKMIPNFYSAQMRTTLWKKPTYILETSFILLFSIGLAIQFEIVLFFKLSSFLAMIYFGYIVFNLNIYKKTTPILAILVLSMIWLEIAFIALFVEALFEIYTLKLSLHIFAIGFVTNLLIRFGSRVTLGHAVPSQKIFADTITVFLFILTQVILIVRIVASSLFIMENELFIEIIYLSTVLWMLLFILWIGRYGRILFRV